MVEISIANVKYQLSALVVFGRWVVDDPKGLYGGNVAFPVENNFE